jgi:hypothetical protein
MKQTSLIMFACVALWPAWSAAQPRLSYGLVYDAASKCGPIPVDERTFDVLKHHPERVPETGICDFGTRPRRFKDGEGVPLLILHPRFLTVYSSAIVKQINRGSGVIDIRGFTEVVAAAAGAAAATPATHGGRPPSAVVIAPIAAAQVIAQMVDQSQMNVPEQTLVAQARDLADANRTLDADVREFDRQLARIQPPDGAPAQPCADQLGTPDAAALRTCVAALGTIIESSTSCTRQHGCGPEPPSCTGPQFRWTSHTFACVVQRIDLRIADLKRLRARLDEFAFSAAADRIVTESEQLITRIQAYQQNLAIVDTAVRDFEVLRGAEIGSAPLSIIRRSELKKQLKERYGTVLDEAELNLLARAELEAGSSRQFHDRFTEALKSLTNRIAVVRCQLEPSSDCARDRQIIQAKRIDGLPDARAILDRERLVAQRAAVVVDKVDSLNRSFADVFQAINAVYDTFGDSDPQAIEVDVKEGAGTNRIVFASLVSTERFSPYRFDVAAPVVPPAAAPAAGVQPPLFAAPQNVAFSVNPVSVAQNPPQPFDFELHLVWRANIVSGVLFSSIGNVDYAVRSRPKIVNGQPVTANGEPVLESFVTESGRQVPAPHYFLGLNFYPWYQDSYPGLPFRWRNAVGVLGGVALDKPSNFFAGINVEPVVGIDVAVGGHFGRQTVLQDGFTNGAPVDTGAAPPTRERLQPGVFLMIGFDLKIFRTIFGGPTSVPLP